MVRGELIHGLMHPEMGHVRIPHDRTQDPFPGACPFHEDCLEGLAAGPAIEARWGQRGETLPPEHPAWPLEASYLAYGLVSIICVLSPQRIILGGGIISVPGLLEMVQENTLGLLNNYIQKPEITEGVGRYIATPGLGNRAGVLGAVALGMEAVL
jgi:fructokinase